MTSETVVAKVLYLRQHYHFGARRIRDYLERYHQVRIATGTVHRVLVRHGGNRLPASQKYRRHKKRWKRYEKKRPGHRVQMDLKFNDRLKEWEDSYNLHPPHGGLDGQTPCERLGAEASPSP